MSRLLSCRGCCIDLKVLTAWKDGFRVEGLGWSVGWFRV